MGYREDRGREDDSIDSRIGKGVYRERVVLRGIKSRRIYGDLGYI